MGGPGSPGLVEQGSTDQIQTSTNSSHTKFTDCVPRALWNADVTPANTLASAPLYRYHNYVSM